MKKHWNVIFPVWLLWIIVCILSIGGYFAVFLIQAQTTVVSTAVIAALVFVAAGWIYLSLRIFRFHIRLRTFFRKLLSNDYSTGIRDIPWLKDEISSLTELVNKSADRLRSYDQLRAERTGLSFRAMNLLFRNSEQRIIFADMEKKQFRFNPAMQELYGVKQETYSFETIENQDANSRFVRVFLITTLRDAITKESTAVLKLPQRETAHEISFRLEPLKDNSEKVRFAFIFIISSRNVEAGGIVENALESKILENE